MKRKGRIYKAEDTILHKVYIGQTFNTLEVRKKQHLKFALKKLDKTYFSTFYKMIRFLGKENFKWEIIEDNIPEEDLNDKEVYYIKKYDSYENGYNSNMGGQKTHGSILNENDVKKIIELLKDTDLSMTEISKKFVGCTRETVSDINCGETWFNSDLFYPIREQGWNKQINFSDQQIDEIIDLLKNSNLSYKEIAKKFNCNPTTIKKISDGESYHLDGINYPIREKMFSHLDNDIILKVAEMLKTSNKVQTEIADIFNIKRKSVSNINNGTYYKQFLSDNGYSFPIRKN